METSSLIVYESRNSSYTLNDELIFNIPPSVYMLNPQDTFLKFNLRIGEGLAQIDATNGNQIDKNHYFKLCLNPEIGASALIRELTISSADGTVLESFNNYNRLIRTLENYSNNTSYKDKKNVFEGAGSLWGSLQNVLYTSDYSLPQTLVVNNTVEICLPLRLSGVLNSYQPFPNGPMGGLTIRILLEEDVWKVLTKGGGGQGKDFMPSIKDIQNLSMGYVDKRGDYRIHDGGGPIVGAAVADVEIVSNENDAHAGNHADTNMCCWLINDDMSVHRCPFQKGQRIIISGLTINPNNTPKADLDAVIDYVELDGINQRVKITFEATLDFNAGGNNTSQNLRVRVCDTVNLVNTTKITPELVISNMELIVGKCTPSSKQMDILDKTINSTGYAVPYFSWRDYAVNNASGSMVISNVINCDLRRCQSIISAWEKTDREYGVVDALVGYIDAEMNPQNYQYIINNVLTPNQRVDCTRYIRPRSEAGGWNAVHIKETEDALESAGYTTRDLTNIDGCFVIGRSLSRYGHTFDMKETQADTRLNINFVAMSKNVLYHNWVKHIREAVITKSGVFVNI